MQILLVRSQEITMTSDSLLSNSLRKVLTRDLRSLDAQIAAYPDDESLWQVRDGISNSAGTLAMHLTGNIRHFFGSVLGGSGYVRDREAEFGKRGVSRADLRADVQAALRDVKSVLDGITPDQLEATYPLEIAGNKVRTSDFLTHLSVHFTYHLGQLDYHRRLLTRAPKPVEMLSPRYLALTSTD